MTPPTSRPSFRTVLVGLAAAASLGLAACGSGSSADSGIASLGGQTATTAATSGGGSGGTATDAASREKAFLEFAQCMRDNGVDMADPQFNDDGMPEFGGQGGGPPGGGGPAFDPNDTTFQAAQEACRSKLEGAFGDMQMSAEEQAQMQDQFTKFAQCMRDNGVDMPDPQFDSSGRPQMGGGQDGGSFRPDPSDPKWQAAQQACQDYQPRPPGASD